METKLFTLMVSLFALVFLSVAEAKQRNRSPNLSQPYDPNPIPPNSLPKNSIMLPTMRQATFYTCGVASLQSCLYYWQVFDSTEEQLAIQCGTTEENGTPPENIVAVAQSYNLTAFLKEGTTLEDLEKAIIEGYSVILDVQAWTEDEPPVDWKNTWEDGHYVALVGIDDKYLFIMDPSTGGTYAYLPKDEFLDRWHDYEILQDGSRREYVHAAIFIKGENAWPYPRSITYMG